MWPFIGKLLSGALLWCCVFFNVTQFVIFEDLSILDLALSGVKGFRVPSSVVSWRHEAIPKLLRRLYAGDLLSATEYTMTGTANQIAHFYDRLWLTARCLTDVLSIQWIGCLKGNPFIEPTPRRRTLKSLTQLSGTLRIPLTTTNGECRLTSPLHYGGYRKPKQFKWCYR